MGDINAKQIDELDYYKGAHAIPGIKFHSAGRELGVTAWGMNVLDIEAGCTAYPEHDHAKDAQEEVYVVLRGSGTLDAGDLKVALTEGTLVRVGPAQTRKILPGPQGIVILAIGGTPGKAYPAR